MTKLRTDPYYFPWRNRVDSRIPIRRSGRRAARYHAQAQDRPFEHKSAWGKILVVQCMAHNTPLFVCAIGSLEHKKVDDVRAEALEKAEILTKKHREHRGFLSSRQALLVDGAIVAFLNVISIAGLPDSHNEALTLGVAIKLGLITLVHVQVKYINDYRFNHSRQHNHFRKLANKVLLVGENTDEY